jgi:vacuolar-type H+-ATPase subunit E/Vma4
MALDVLLEAIAEHGAAEARQILEAARAEADAIRTAADARTEQRCAAARATREAELRVELDTNRDRALRKARVEVLFRRARYLDTVFEAAEGELPGVLDRPGSEHLLERLSAEGLEYFPSGSARIRCRAGLAGRVSAQMPLVPVIADDSIPEGIIVEAAEGWSHIDNTLPARLRRQRRALSIVLLAALQEGR